MTSAGHWNASVTSSRSSLKAITVAQHTPTPAARGLSSALIVPRRTVPERKLFRKTGPSSNQTTPCPTIATACGGGRRGTRAKACPAEARRLPPMQTQRTRRYAGDGSLECMGVRAAPTSPRCQYSKARSAGRGDDELNPSGDRGTRVDGSRVPARRAPAVTREPWPRVEGGHFGIVHAGSGGNWRVGAGPRAPRRALALTRKWWCGREPTCGEHGLCDLLMRAEWRSGRLPCHLRAEAPAGASRRTTTHGGVGRGRVDLRANSCGETSAHISPAPVIAGCTRNASCKCPRAGVREQVVTAQGVR